MHNNDDNASDIDQPIPYRLTALAVVELGRAYRERTSNVHFFGSVSRAVDARLLTMAVRRSTK